MADVHRQDGGLEHLGLAEIDPHLDYPGKSVEQISDPEFRLAVLWTCVGQYGAEATRDRADEGNDFPTVNDARHQQLIARWTTEARSVYPDIRTKGLFHAHEQRVVELVDDAKPLAAYLELIDIRNHYPEFIHADVRFDLMAAIYGWSDDLNQADSFRPMLMADMFDETRPHGAGYCDDAERLRRYHRLMEWDESMAGIITDYIIAAGSVSVDQNPDYFDGITDMATVIQTIVDRRYAELAGHLIESGLLSFDQEVLLLAIL